MSTGQGMPPGFPPGFPGGSVSREERRLLRLFRSLDEAGRRSLLDYADFLAERAGRATAEKREIPKPKDIPRPEEESVPRAIRRLSERYFMLDKDQLFQQTSLLMAQHVMQGRPAAEVIDELEALFAEAYRKLLEDTT